MGETLKITLSNNLPNLSRGMTAVVNKVVRATAEQIAADCKAAMAEPKHGRLYGTHRASAADEAPAIDSGNLAGSISVDMVEDLRAIVGVGAEYGAALEFGTAHIAPRPFLTPAVEQAAQHFGQDVADAIEQAARG